MTSRDKSRPVHKVGNHIFLFKVKSKSLRYQIGEMRPIMSKLTVYGSLHSLDACCVPGTELMGWAPFLPLHFVNEELKENDLAAYHCGSV